MSDVTPTPEEVTPPVVEPVIPPAEDTPPAPTEPITSGNDEPEITEKDLQDLIDRIMVEAPTPEPPIPTSPQFAGEKDPLTETVEQLDKLVDQTVALEQEKDAAITKATTLEQEITTLQSKVDFVDTAFARISDVIWIDLATQIAKGEITDVPKYLIPWNMEKVLADKILWPLVQAHLEWRDINIPKFLGEIVASKKAALPNIISQPEPTPTKVNPKDSFASEIARISNQWF